MQVRQILFRDVFQLSRVVKRMSLKGILRNRDIVDVSKIKDKKEIEKIQVDKGIELFLEVFSECGDAEIEIMKLIADFANCSIEEVQKWNLKQIKEFIQEFLKVNTIEEVKSLFTQAIS
jgi:hypothetical protein